MSGTDLTILSGSAFEQWIPEVPWNFEGYGKLLAAIDKKCLDQMTLLASQIACKAGCHHCCRRIPSILPMEWAWIRQSGSSLPDRPSSEPKLGSDLHPGEILCGHLDAQGWCGIYPARPLICRTHGLLLLSEQGLDHCQWNFQDLEEVDEDLVFRLENLHETLLRLNLAFVRASYPSKWRELAASRIEFQA